MRISDWSSYVCSSDLSSESQRQTVVAEILATRPRSIASRATSPALQRLKGTPLVAGNSQARAFTSILAAGGKERRSAGAGPILQCAQSLLVKRTKERRVGKECDSRFRSRGSP